MRRTAKRGLLWCASLAVWAAVSHGAEVPWSSSLSYDGGGTWSIRVPVEIQHRGTEPLQGAPVQVPVRGDDGTAALVGQPVASLRVQGANGVEYVFGLRGGDGAPKRDGTLAVGDVVTVPVETGADTGGATVRLETADAEPDTAAAQPKPADAAEAVTLFLYAGNPDAWAPAEWLGTALGNLDFEQGDAAPTGWQTHGADATHRMSLQDGGAYSGRKCARCEVDPGANPEWVKYAQGGCPVRPGQRFRFSGWAKAQDVVGRVGWYIHVDGNRVQMVNKSDTSSGTFGWRRMSVEFEIPEEANVLSCGTLLHGTGTAWFDAAELEEIGGADTVSVRVLAAEKQILARTGADAAWPDDPRWAWRAPVVVSNVGSVPYSGTVVTIDTRRLQNRLGKLLGFGAAPAFCLVDSAQPEQALMLTGKMHDGLFAVADVPARTAKTLWLYLGTTPAPAGTDSAGVPGLAAWAGGDLNLAVNGTMEQGADATPEVWHAGEEGNEVKGRFRARRVRKGMNGSWCLELDVPKDLPDPGWTGWRQMVPVKPGRQYLLSGFISTEGVDGSVKIHGHFRRADRSHTASPFFGTTTSVAGDSGWTRTSVTVTTPPDCAFVEIHLTMNGRGTLRHDNVLLAPVAEGVVGAPDVPAQERPSFAAWAVNPLVKVFREDVPPAAPRGRLEVYAFRNARKAAQLCLRAAAAGEATVEVGPLRRVDGEGELPAPRVYRVGYVPIDFPMGYAGSTAPAHHRLLPRGRGSDGWAGWWPDPLVPMTAGKAVALAANATQPVWFDVHVPATAPPGRYAATVEVRHGGEVLGVPLVVTVWGLTIPEAKGITAIYDLRRGRGRNPFAGADVSTWYRFLARYNVSPGFVVANPVFTYEDGRVALDTAEFDQQARLLFDELKIGKVYTPNRWFYACGWAYPPRGIFGLEPFDEKYVKAWKQAYAMFIDHLTRNGWRDNFVHYISDEPHKTSDVTINGIARIADMAREVAPDVLVYSSTWHYIDGLADHLTLWGMGPHGSFDPEKHAARKAAGDRFWYTTDGQMCTDTPFLAIERLLPWFCFKYGCEAYEFWGVSWWTYNPWERGWHSFIRQSSDGENYRWVRYPNGDGYLAYPGEDLGLSEPVPSIRLVAAREGVDDYHLLLALDSFARKGSARAQAALAAMCDLVRMPNRGGRYSTDIMPDPAPVIRARIEAGQLLEELRQH